MNFYKAYELCDSKHPVRSGFNGILVAPSIEQVLEWTKTASDYQDIYYLIRDKNYKLTDVKFVVTPDPTTEACVSLVAYFTGTDKSDREFILSSIKIATVNYNCSALHIFDLYSIPTRKGMTTYFMNEILKWAKFAGYTFIFGNTAGSQQNREALPFFKKVGFTELGNPYRNIRSGQDNHWIQYLINHYE